LKFAAICATLLYASLVLMAACSVDVRHDSDHKAVDVHSPFADVSVRTNDVDAAASIGLPVYRGARPLIDDHDSQSADVTVGNRWFGVKVIAAKFESDDTPESIVSFYRREMAKYGDVTECRGDLNFEQSRSLQQPSCREHPFSREVQLGVGTTSVHRMIVVKPRGAVSELSMVYIRTQK
jgi:hypothetical protein